MAWECACGISNHDEAFRCAGCGWSRAQGKQDEFDGAFKQPVEDIKTRGKYKWEKYILGTVIIVFVMPGIEIADGPIALKFLIQLGLLAILFFLL